MRRSGQALRLRRTTRGSGQALSFRWLDDARRDTAHAVRSLAKHRAFTAAVVLTLAVGIGATTAIYSVVNIVLLQPLPLPDADRLVRIFENERPRDMPAVNYGEYLDWRARTTTLSGLATATFNPQVMMPAPAGLIRVTGGFVSSNYFEVLGAKAMPPIRMCWCWGFTCGSGTSDPIPVSSGPSSISARAALRAAP
jgi:hypothetical protein